MILDQQPAVAAVVVKLNVIEQTRHAVNLSDNGGGRWNTLHTWLEVLLVRTSGLPQGHVVVATDSRMGQSRRQVLC